MKTKIISPSLLNVSKNQRIKVSKTLFNLGIKWIHYDYMDAKFVPNKAIEIFEIKKIVNKFSNYISDIHIMAYNPEKIIDQIINVVTYATFHYEVFENASNIKDFIAKYSSKIKLGIAINPDTSEEVLLPFLDKIDLVLVMSVVPGKGGQLFIENSYKKIANLAKIRKEKKYKFLIQVDGGIKDFNAKKVFDFGADVIVSGTYLAVKPSKQKILKLLAN
ncbi:Ribulose-phosphate 3-epimerase [Mesomycoplasma hyorhinis HUB-1]|uniref:ribulose-phosphate 3-epimerase n=1 Tax=Mesomycoplasma hyorhinis TaxID=2100 RepID=UPI0001E13399|nr:Ribulose-phosphate 3-epimerase [Mesomycoplasma hyorhinis HUB-1]